MKSIPDFSIENEIADAYHLSPLIGHNKKLIIAGCDEAGRGPLCGPVVAAAVIFLKNFESEDQGAEPTLTLKNDLGLIINDSKKMTAAKREAAYKFITTNPDIIWSVATCSPTEIDELNILWASMLAMERAITKLSLHPDFVLVDGNRLPQNLTHAPARKGTISSLASFDYISQMSGNNILGRAIVKGDSKSISIAAASIIAKVTRDRIMKSLAVEFPQYGWDKNAGYPTAAHLQAIKIYGINEHYRKTFGPVKKFL